MKIEKEIIKKIDQGEVTTAKDLEKIKKIFAKKYKTSFLSNVHLLQFYHKMGGSKEQTVSLLRTRPVRSLSGVVNISVLTKPFPCPGKCIYCPDEKASPKSYLKDEPAAMRAWMSNYHPAKQTTKRIEALEKTGHPTEKIELRIVGGTWSFYPKKYRRWFVKNCFDACNKKKSKTLKESQRKNEKAKHRIVCLSIETRPDFITKEEIKEMRALGVTMVELGVQSVDNNVLSFIKRGHTTESTIRATKLLKDAGFKICYQVMLNLPKSTPQKDIKTFKELFQNSDYQPDFLKIYPCLVIANTELFSLFKKGKYTPFSEKQLVKIIAKIKKDIIPYYVRIQRLFRDIPAKHIFAGCKVSNLREVVAKVAEKEKWRCRCIRCREVKESYNPSEKVYLFRENYLASKGNEIFLSLENKDRSKLFALLRLRKPEKTPFLSLKNSAIIREIKTYGLHLPVKGQNKSSPQHKGMGKKLVKIAEKITREEFKKKRVAVISGVGVRDYWKNLGYQLRGSYMVKDL